MTPQIPPDFWAELRRHVAGDVKNDLYSRTLYSTDASNYQVQPLGVFFPRNADDIQAATEIAAKYRVPVLVRGGGTSLAGQAVNEALIMDASRHMTRVLEVNTAEHWAR
ncbi:MAG TPA: FAD-binding oxidoreductase, partial [Anaerolineae bacterium]|nr:FAD-binding oxidoreductase [Anaerolineae bacterium]